MKIGNNDINQVAFKYLGFKKKKIKYLIVVERTENATLKNERPLG